MLSSDLHGVPAVPLYFLKATVGGLREHLTWQFLGYIKENVLRTPTSTPSEHSDTENHGLLLIYYYAT